MSLSKVLRVGGVALVMATLAAAGLGKFADIPAFADTLPSWQLVPAWLRPVLVWIVPAGELLLGLAWLVGLQRTRAVIGGAGLLCLFTLVYATHLVIVGPPDCGCLGKLAAYFDARHDQWIVLARNGVLVLLISPSVVAAFRSGRHHSRVADFASSSLSLSTPVTSHSARMRGMSILELFVVLAIVAILVALAAPAFVRLRERSRVALQLSLLSQHGAVVGGTYSSDFKDAYPCFARPTPHPTVIECKGVAYRDEIRYFDSFWTWNIALADRYYDGSPWGKKFRSPLALSGHGGAGGPARSYTDFWYPCVFLGDPDHWRQKGYADPPAQLRGTHVSEVRHPSEKVLIRAAIPAGSFVDFRLTGEVHAAFVDGHATVVHPSKMRREFGGDGAPSDWNLWTPHPGRWVDGLFHTWHGIAGRDIGTGDPQEEE